MSDYEVTIRLHTEKAQWDLANPEGVRFMVGKYFDSLGLQEEIDYTLEVRRVYE